MERAHRDSQEPSEMTTRSLQGRDDRRERMKTLGRKLKMRTLTLPEAKQLLEDIDAELLLARREGDYEEINRLAFFKSAVDAFINLWEEYGPGAVA